MVVASRLFGFSKIPQGDRTRTPSPCVGMYRTSDERYISLILLQSDKHWTDLVTRLGVPEMADDPRFADATARAENSAECIAKLDEAFGAHPLAHWKEVLADFAGVWTPFQTLDELYEDPPVIANGYLPMMVAANGRDVQLVASPAQFDQTPVEMTRCPEHGEHTELTLVDAGYSWDEVAALKESGAIG